MALQWQAIALMLVGLYAGAGVSGGATQSGDYESLGLAIFFGYMWTQDFTMLLSLRRVAWHNVGSIFGMHLLAVGVALAMNAYKGAVSFIDYYSLTNTMRDPFFWLFHLLITILACGPPAAVANWSAAFQPSFTNALYRLDAHNEAQGLVEPGYAPAPGSSSKQGGYGAIVTNPVGPSSGLSASPTSGAGADTAALPLLKNATSGGSIGRESSGNGNSSKSGGLSKNSQAPVAASSSGAFGPSSSAAATTTNGQKQNQQHAAGSSSSSSKGRGSPDDTGSGSPSSQDGPDPEAGSVSYENPHNNSSSGGRGSKGKRGGASTRNNNSGSAGEGSAASVTAYNPLANR